MQRPSADCFRLSTAPRGYTFLSERSAVKLTNDQYLILIHTRNTTERYYRDRDGWLKISSRGREFRMTAEQVLNHLLPAAAGVKANVSLTVEHREPPTSKASVQRRPRKASGGG